MKNSRNNLARKINFLTKEVIDLKRESSKIFLLNKRIYTVKEAALVSGLSASFIYNSISYGRLKHSRPSPNRILVKKYDLNKFLRSSISR